MITPEFIVAGLRIRASSYERGGKILFAPRFRQGEWIAIRRDSRGRLHCRWVWA